MTRNQMESLGFRYVGTCQCDGATNFKYSKDNYIFYIRPKRENFHVKQGVNYILKNIPLNQFDKYVEVLGMTLDFYKRLDEIKKLQA